MIKFLCRNCYQVLRVQDKYDGVAGVCNFCGGQVTISAKQQLTESDNLGTRHDTFAKATAYWLTERLNAPRKDPFVLYRFVEAEPARAALLELPCIFAASDTGNLICTEVMYFGCYRADTGEEGNYEAILCGDDMSFDLWNQARDSLVRHGGKKKTEQQPSKDYQPQKGSVKLNEVRYARNEQHGSGRYKIYSGPNGVSAKAFLARERVTVPDSFIIVETVDGNYCRDCAGLYKEVNPP